MAQITTAYQAYIGQQGFMGMPISCGAMELYGFGYDNPEADLKAAFQHAERYGSHKCAFYIFSDRNTWDIVDQRTNTVVDTKSFPGYGKKLAEYIEKEKLGIVFASDVRRNPNSGHNIQVWVWGVDHKALVKWCEDRNVKCCNNPTGMECYDAGARINLNAAPIPTPDQPQPQV